MKIYLFFVIAYICEVLGQKLLHRNVRQIPADKNRPEPQCGTLKLFLNDLDQENFPWLVKLVYKFPKLSRCGGVLVTDQWVLSSAKCIKSDALQAALLGEYDTTIAWLCTCVGYLATYQRLLIRKKIINDVYGVGLLKLSERAETHNYVTPMCIPPMHDYLIPNATGRAAGWTYLGTYKHLYEETLQSTSMIVVNDTDCNQILNTTLPSYNFCAIQTFKVVPCVPMPGSPFMQYRERDKRYYAVGIMLEEASECDTTKPIIFLEVRHVRYWIRNSIAANKDAK